MCWWGVAGAADGRLLLKDVGSRLQQGV
jgi:hypothetical protein